MPELTRRLRLHDAVVIGVGSMVGAGVFAVWAPAAAAAGGGLFAGLALAALVAWCNATSSAQLAAAYPTSGGTYIYGREQLGPWWGYLAGWGFVVGKTASAAAMALTFAAYVVPPGVWQRPLAAAAVVALAAVNYRGVTRTARLTRLIVAFVLAVLAAVVVATWSGWTPTSWLGSAPAIPVGIGPVAASTYGVLQAGGLLFFAFAGYARIATLGEEVVDPRRTIPLAIMLALGCAVLVYALVGAGVVGLLGVEALASSSAPLLDAVAASPAPWLGPVVRVGGAVAALGALLALIAGIGRTALAMARHGDLPKRLASVHPKFKVPHVAEVVLAAVVSGLVLAADLRGVIGFSSFGVLLYYFVANLAAFTQRTDRLYPRAVQVVGMSLCLLLVVTLPWQSVVVGVAVFAVGVGARLLRMRVASA